MTEDPITTALLAADHAYGRAPGTAARLLAGADLEDPDDAFEQAAEALDEWDPEVTEPEPER